jgi:hypothetical protein
MCFTGLRTKCRVERCRRPGNQFPQLCKCLDYCAGLRFCSRCGRGLARRTVMAMLQQLSEVSADRGQDLAKLIAGCRRVEPGH